MLFQRRRQALAPLGIAILAVLLSLSPAGTAFPGLGLLRGPLGLVLLCLAAAMTRREVDTPSPLRPDLRWSPLLLLDLALSRPGAPIRAPGASFGRRGRVSAHGAKPLGRGRPRRARQLGPRRLPRLRPRHGEAHVRHGDGQGHPYLHAQPGPSGPPRSHLRAGRTQGGCGLHGASRLVAGHSHPAPGAAPDERRARGARRLGGCRGLPCGVLHVLPLHRGAVGTGPRPRPGHPPRLSHPPRRRGCRSRPRALLPWLHIKMVPAAVVLGVVALVRLRGRPLVVFLAVAAGMALVFVGYYQIVFGHPTPLALYGAKTPKQLRNATPLLSIPGLLLDASFGLLPHAPAFLVGLAGLPLLCRRSRSEWIPIVGVVAAVLAPLVTWRVWWAGFCPPGSIPGTGRSRSSPSVSPSGSPGDEASPAGLRAFWPSALAFSSS